MLLPLVRLNCTHEYQCRWLITNIWYYGIIFFLSYAYSIVNNISYDIFFFLFTPKINIAIKQKQRMFNLNLNKHLCSIEILVLGTRMDVSNAKFWLYHQTIVRWLIWRWYSGTDVVAGMEATPTDWGLTTHLRLAARGRDTFDILF